MEIIMNSSLKTVSEMEELLKSNSEIKLSVSNKKEQYECLAKNLISVKYTTLTKKEKGVVKKFIKRLTVYSKVQIKRIITKYRQGKLVWVKWQNNPGKHYTREDVWLLEATEAGIRPKFQGKHYALATR